MPCKSDYQDYETNTELSRKIDRLTAMLCACCSLIETKKVKLPEPEFLTSKNEIIKLSVAAWWDGHKEIDKKRKALEEEKKALAKERKDKKEKVAEALSKLTDEEKRLLGLD